jgi:tRNA (cytosine38-C5)-methyltransferase
LTNIGFSYQEFLINPTEAGIPNSRLRYYLIGKRQPEPFAFETQEEIISSLNFKFDERLAKKFDLESIKTLKDYLSDLADDELQLFLIPDKTLEKVIEKIDPIKI